MYFTFDTKNFTDADYEKFTAIHGWSTRMSCAAGENNRGRLLLADRLLIPEMEQACRMIPAGYHVEESRYKSSDGCMVKEEVEVVEEESREGGKDKPDPVGAVRRTIAARGAAAGLSLLSDFTVIGVLTKSADIFPLLQEILSACAVDDYASCNILDIYKGIPKLRAIYWEDEEKRMHLQEMFDRLCAGTCRLSDIRNPYDALYLRGMLDFLHIGTGERGN